jgi:hypothetical protein
VVPAATCRPHQVGGSQPRREKAAKDGGRHVPDREDARADPRDRIAPGPAQDAEVFGGVPFTLTIVELP